MSSIVKIVAAVAAAVALLLGIAAIYLFTIFDPNDFKDEIHQLVHEQTGLDLGIEGDLSLSVFPWLGVSAGRITLDAPDGRLGSLEEARIYAKTGPLFSGKLEVRGVSLKRLKLKLTVAENGQPNWAIGQAVAPGTPSSKVAEPVTPAALPLAAFTVGELNIEDAQVIYQDLQQGTYHQLGDFTLTTRDVDLAGGSFPLSGSLTCQNAPTGTAIPVSFSTRATPIMEPLGAQLEELQVKVANAELGGTIIATRLLNDLPDISAQLRVTDLNPRDWGALLDSPDLAAVDFPLTLSLDLNLDGAAAALTISALELANEALTVSASLSVTQFMQTQTPRYSATLGVEATRTRQLLTRLGIDAAAIEDPALLGALNLKAQIKGESGNIAIPELALQLDDIKVQGSMVIKDIVDPFVQFNLQSGPVNLDRYFPPASEDAEQEPDISAAQAALLPLAAMREINSTGRIDIAQLIASGLTMDNVELEANARGGLIKVTRLNADLYEGKLAGDATIDARGDTPKIATHQTLTGMQATPVLKSLADIDAIAGRLNLELDATTSGNSTPQLTENLNGVLQLAVQDGQLNGMDLERMVCSAIANMRQQPLATAASETPLTRFKQLDANMKIRNGIVHTEALNLAIEKLKASGTGSINLLDNTLDYRLKALVIGDLEDPACRVSEQFKAVEWPVRCKGSLDGEIGDLCGLDSDGLRKIAEEQLRARAQEAITDKLGEEAGKLFEGLFGK